MSSNRCSTVVRAATVEDARWMAVIHVEGWRFAYRGILPDDLLNSLSVQRRQQSHRERIAAGDTVQLVACDSEDNIVGFIAAGGTREPAERDAGFGGEVFGLYLLPRTVGQGYGRALMRAAAEGLAERGWRDVCVRALRENYRGVAFYQRLGGQLLRECLVEIRGVQYAEQVYGFRNAEDLSQHW